MNKTFAFLAAGLILSAFTACGEGNGDGDNQQVLGMTSATSASAQTSAATSASSTAPAASSAAPSGSSAATVLFSFDTVGDIQGFALQDYEPGDPMYTNLFYQCGDKAKDDGEPAIDCTKATLTQSADAAVGGTAGGLKVTVPFFDYNQSVELQVNNKTPLDITGKILRVKVNADKAGFTSDGSYPGGGYLFIKTGSGYDYFRGDWKNFELKDRGTWIEFSLDATAKGNESEDWDPDTIDLTAVMAIGIQISSGGGSSTIDPPTDAVVYVDEFTEEAAK